MAPELNQRQEYDGRKVDVYAMGITLLSLAFNMKFIQRASKEDPVYQYVVNREFELFWDEVAGKLRAKYGNNDLYEQVSTDFKDLVNNMISY